MTNAAHQNDWSGEPITPLRLPVLSPDVVAQTTQWTRRVGTADFKIFSKHYTLQWRPPTLLEKTIPSGETFVLVAKGEDQSFEITLGYSLLAVWLRPYLDQVDLTSFEKPYQLILIEVALAELLAQFEARMGYALTLSTKDSTPSYTHTTAFVCRSDEGGEFPILIRSQHASYEKMMALFCDLIQKKPTCNAPLRMRVLAGVAHLGWDSLHALQVGSIIQLTTATNPLETPLGLLENVFVCPLQSGVGAAQAQMTDNFLRFDPERKGLGMSTENTLQTTLETLKVPVYFEINHFDVPVDSLSQLQKGHVFNLNKPVNEGIDIIVNGRVVAKGEVVQIGQNYGVLVQEVY